MAGPRRDKSATESLLQIAVALEIALVFFGALALNGLRLYPGVVVLVGSLAATAVLLVLYRVVAYPAGRIFGHAGSGGAARNILLGCGDGNLCAGDGGFLGIWRHPWPSIGSTGFGLNSSHHGVREK